MGTFAPWYKFTPFQLEVLGAWERGDAAALANLNEARVYAQERGRVARVDRLKAVGA